MRWAAHATWYSAARASTPAHGDSLTHGSNARRQTRVQPCSPPSVADDHHASLPLDARSRHCGCARARWAAHATWYSAARASTPVHGDSLTHESNARDAKHACSLARRAPPSVADDHHASLPLDARSRHCDCARVRWAAHATWYSAARASTPAHGDSLTHGSNARRQTRVQPCSPCASLCRRRSPRASLPLDARSMHCGCARVRWAAPATRHSAARASTPAHGDSLTHGSNARRQSRVQPCSPCT